MNSFKGGDSFGHHGLEGNRPRFYSTRAITDAYVGLVPREIYRKIIEKQRKERIQQTQLFLRQIPLMKHWSNRELSLLIDRFQVKEVIRAGSVVFKEGDLANKVVVVKEG